MARSAAESAATWAISSLPSTSRACLPTCSDHRRDGPSRCPASGPSGWRRRPTLRMPCWTIARASTVAVVVPSPATSFVLVATSLASWAPMFSHGSSSSISLAIVTPSLVMVGAPHFLSRTTLRPLRPERDRPPRRRACPRRPRGRAGRPRRTSVPSLPSEPPSYLTDDASTSRAERIRYSSPSHLDLGAAVLGVDDLVPDLHVHGDAVARPRTGPGPPR